MRYRNTKTKKTFEITKGENQFDAREVGGEDKGHIDYQIKANAMDLKEIFSVPEKTGLGTLLLFLAVKDAMAKNCKSIEILNAALNAQGFYFKMGCTQPVDILEGGDFTPEEREKLVIQCPIKGEAMTVLNASHAKMFDTWEPA